MSDKDLDETIKTYNHIAPRFALQNFEVSFWQPQFDRFAELLPKGRVLEVGSGAGRDSLLFTQSGYDYFGFDASQGMLEVAKARNPNAEFALISFYDFELPENSFDGFWAAASLLHAPKNRIVDVLKRLLRVLKPGGIGMIAVKEKLEVDEGVIVDERFDEPISRFFAFYTKEELEEVLQSAGFKIVDYIHRVEDDEINTRWLCFYVKK